jgi:serine/threonine-protein kinase RsbW
LGQDGDNKCETRGIERGIATVSDWAIAIPNTLFGMRQGLDSLSAWLQRLPVDDRSENRAHLVFEEIVSNVIRHGFADHNVHIIRAAAHLGANELILCFEDDGRPFNPTAEPEPARASSLAEASIGGRGLMLVRAVASWIGYEWREGRNRLTVMISRP